MRGNEVKIGSAYVCRVSGELCRVEIVRELFARRGRKFSAMNCRTGRMIEVSAARLRSEILTAEERESRKVAYEAKFREVERTHGRFMAPAHIARELQRECVALYSAPEDDTF